MAQLPAQEPPSTATLQISFSPFGIGSFHVSLIIDELPRPRCLVATEAPLCRGGLHLPRLELR